MRKTSQVKEMENKTKVEVCEAKLRAFKEVFDRLNSKEEKDIYRMAKRRDA